MQLYKEAKIPGTEVILADTGVTHVVKIGDTVRRPVRDFTESVQSYLAHIRAKGFTQCPEPLGVDYQGREVLSFVEGEIPVEPFPKYIASDELIVELAKLQRKLHDAAEDFIPANNAIWGDIPGGNPEGILAVLDKSELVAHMDYCPGNIVFKDGLPKAFIDFDLACPTTRVADIVNMLNWWAPLKDPMDRDPVLKNINVFQRVKLFADIYGMTKEQRRLLVPTAKIRAHNSYIKVEAAAKVDPVFKKWWDEGWDIVLLRTKAWLDTSTDEINAALNL